MTVRQFRLLLTASVVAGIFGGVVDHVFPKLLPEAFRSAQEAHDATFSSLRQTILGILGAVLLVALIASFYGLYRLRTWAPRLAMLVTVLGLLFVLADGAFALSGLANAMSYLASYLWSAVVLVAYLPPLDAEFRHGNSRQAMRAIMIVSVDLLAMLLYAEGLISPLTPSVGMPRPWDLLVYAAVPVGLLALCLRASRSVAARAVIALQILIVVALTALLLWSQT